MQSREIDQSSNPRESRDGGDGFARKVVGVVIFPLLLAATYFISQIPYTVTSFRQFDNYANGKRVRFIGTCKEKVGTFTQVDFEGQTILVDFLPGKIQRSPDVGGKYWVVGGLQRSSQPSAKIIISDAEFLPSTER